MTYVYDLVKYIFNIILYSNTNFLIFMITLYYFEMFTIFNPFWNEGSASFMTMEIHDFIYGVKLIKSDRDFVVKQFFSSFHYFTRALFFCQGFPGKRPGQFGVNVGIKVIFFGTKVIIASVFKKKNTRTRPVKSASASLVTVNRNKYRVRPPVR